MILKVALISLVSLIGTCVSVYGEFDCKEYPLKQNDPFTPAQTVRVCGSGDYEDIPIILRKLLGIEKPSVEVPAQHLLPPFEEPANTPKFSNGFSQNVVAPYGESRHIPWFGESKQQNPADLIIPYHAYGIYNRPTESDLIDFRAIDEPKQMQKKQNLDSIADDVKDVKQSVATFESYLKDVAQNILTNRKIEEPVTNINVILKVDPALEYIMKTILQLAEAEREGEKTVEQNKQNEGEETVEQNQQNEGEGSVEQNQQNEGEGSVEQNQQNESEETVEQNQQNEGEGSVEQNQQNESEETVEQNQQNESEETVEQNQQNEGEGSVEQNQQNESEETVEQNQQNESEETVEQNQQNEGEGSVEQNQQNESEGSVEQNEGEETVEQNQQNESEETTEDLTSFEYFIINTLFE